MKLLIVRVGAMGDVLHALASVAALRQVRPDWQIDWIVDERWHSLLAGDAPLPLVNDVLTLPIRAWKRFPRSPELLHSLRRLHGLRRRRYDAVVDLQGTLRSAAIGRLAAGLLFGSPLAGFSDPREAPARFLYNQRLPRLGTHVVEQYTALLATACGLALSPAVPKLPRDTPAERWAEALLVRLGSPARVAILAPSAGWPAKQWLAAHFATVARILAGQGWTVLVNNAGGHDAVALEVLAASGDAARSLACSIAEFTALLRSAALLVGGDSGPTHLAAALGTPLVALFGPTNPARNGPWGSGPQRVLRDAASVTSYSHVATADPGLALITPAQVLAAVAEVTASR